MSKWLRHCLEILLCAALASPCLAKSAPPRNLKLSDPLRKCVVATYRLCADKQEPAKDVHCYLFLPQDEPRQRVESLLFSPEPREIITDKHGRKIAHFTIRRIAPGRHVAVRWIARVKTYQMKVLVKKNLRSRRARISGKTKKLYLADKAMYGIRSRYLRDIARSIAPAGASPLDRARGVCDYLTEHLSYELTGDWDAAEKVLKRGTGSCSEYAYGFIALCRACGVPARYVGSTKCPRKTGCAYDMRGHRWGEAYLEGWGWIPMDILIPGRVGKDFFTITNRHLVLGHGDGGSNSPLGWRYRGKAKGKGGLHTSEEFFWCDSVSQATLKKILAAAGMTDAGKRPSPLEAVSALSKIRKGLCIPFLADLLRARDDEAVERAAEAICRIDTLSARNVRYFARKNRRAGEAMSSALEANAPGRRRKKKAGKWRDLFDGKRLRARQNETGPFKIQDRRLTNSGKTGTLITSHTTSDRCVIDLLFEHTGPGHAALLFGYVGKNVSLKLPFHVPTEPHVKLNYLAGARCKRGLYGASEGELHRATVAVDEYKVRFDFDGKTIFKLEHPSAGPGRIGLAVWDDKTTFSVKRLRVMELPESKAVSDILENAKAMGLKGWPVKRRTSAGRADEKSSEDDRHQ